MASVTDLPSGDYKNNGWTLVGTGVTSAYLALSATGDDTKYVKAPASKNSVTVSFPQNITTIPAGSVITSVSVNLRCNKGAGTPPHGVASQVTFAMTCSDNTARIITRMINPTSTITSYTVGTYAKDPLGDVWDIQRLNKMLFRVYCNPAVADLVRVYELYATVNYRTAPSITVDAPSGVNFTSSPVVDWTYTQVDGDKQTQTVIKIFTSDQVSDTAFNADRTTPVFTETVKGDQASFLLPTPLTANDYWVYAQSTSSFGCVSTWTGRQFSIDAPVPGAPGIPDPTGIQSPGTGIIGTVPDDVTGSASLTLGDTSNMLSVQDADAETSTDGTTLVGTNTATPPVQDPTQAFPGGTAAWLMKATASGTMSLTGDWIEIAASVPITVTAQFLSAVTSRNCTVALNYYDGTFTSVGSALTSASTADSTSTWTSVVATGTTPAGAVYCRPVFTVISPASAESHWVDQLGVMYGTSSPWADGGQMSRNLLSAWYSTTEGTPLSGEAWLPDGASTMTTTAPSGTGASGSLCNKLTYAGFAPSIGYRATGTVFTATTTGTGYTLNKPSGTATGDLMLAYVTSNDYGTIMPPVGWTVANQSRVENGTGDVGTDTDTCLFVLKRTATSSEPSTWTDGFLGTTAPRRQAVVVAYSGCADASLQFVADGVSGTPIDVDTLQSQTVTNSDPNAWRVSAFAVNDDNTATSLVANQNAPGVIPPISYVSAGSDWGSASSSTTYTIYRPPGVLTGDLMIAFVTVSGNATVNTPSGWTLVRKTPAVSGSRGDTLAVFKRTAGSSESASWSAAVSGIVGKTKGTIVHAYRNCADASVQFLAETGSTQANSQTITTGSVTNTDARAWRIAAFSGESEYNHAWTSNEVTERSDFFHATGPVPTGQVRDCISMAVYDSNGIIPSGTYTRTGTMSDPFVAGTSWIGFIKPLPTAPTPPGNETSRSYTNTGAPSNYLTLGVFDSAAGAPIGDNSVWGIYTATSGVLWQSAVSWVGLIRPLQPLQAGYSQTAMATLVDISSVDPNVLTLAGGAVTVTGSFSGSTSGTPNLACTFYRANQVLDYQVAAGNPFDSGAWTKSAATFILPDNTTHMGLTLAVSDRNVADITYFDRVSLALGSDVTYRPGTSRAAHPIWSIPQLQYADDQGTGYGDWASLPGSVTLLPISYDPMAGQCLYVDHTIVPTTNRKYRARTLSYGLEGDLFASQYGPESSEFSFVAESWWLKDIANPTNNLQLTVEFDAGIPVTTTNTATVFVPLGDDPSYVLSEGFKSDSFDLNLAPVNHDDWVSLFALLKAGRTLFLQTDHDQAWWVRPTSDITTGLMPTGQWKSNPLRTIKVTFLQLPPEA